MVSNAANVARSRVQPYSWKVQNSAGPPWSNQAQRLAIRAPGRSRRSVRAVAGQEHRAARDRTDDDDEDPLPAAALLSGFDGGAGSRFQAKREIRSFWYPTWLAQPAALVPGSKLIDAPPANLS